MANFTERLLTELLVATKSGRSPHRAQFRSSKRQYQYNSSLPVRPLWQLISKTIAPLIAHPRRHKLHLWLMALVGLGIWSEWDSKLLLSTGMGILAMLAFGPIRKLDWQTNLLKFREFFTGFPASQQLSLAVGVGSMATLGTYCLISVWSETGNKWLASCLVFQTLLTIILLSIILWQLFQHKSLKVESQVNQTLDDLTDPTPLKRLIAVRKITKSITNSRPNKGVINSPSSAGKNYLLPSGSLPLSIKAKDPNLVQGKEEVSEYLTLMLSQESDPTVRQAIVDSLKVLQDVNYLMDHPV